MAIQFETGQKMANGQLLFCALVNSYKAIKSKQIRIIKSENLKRK